MRFPHLPIENGPDSHAKKWPVFQRQRNPIDRRAAFLLQKRVPRVWILISALPALFETRPSAFRRPHEVLQVPRGKSLHSQSRQMLYRRTLPERV